MRVFITGILCFFLVASASAQRADSLHLDLSRADSLFLANNYQLLAARYQVRSDSALIRQARLWDNPSFSAEFGFNSINSPRPDIGKNGQTAYSVDQVIQLAGKRNKNIQLATLNADYSEAAFQELMRTLKWQLHTAFTQLYFKQRSLGILSEQQQVLQKIVSAYKSADSSGSVAHAEYMRLAQLQLSLKNDYLSIAGDLNDLQGQLQELLGVEQPVVPQIDVETEESKMPDNLPIQALLQKALQDRPDMHMSRLDTQTAAANYNLQKALAVPDLHVGAMYDKNSSVVHNYLGLTMGIDLPFWNRNQGNIRSSKLLAAQSKLKWQQQQNVVQTEVKAACSKYQTFKNAFPPGEIKGFASAFRTLIGHVAVNFTKGNIDLLQFIDFFNSYSDNFNDQNGYYGALFNAWNDLEYAVGAPLQNN